MKFRHFILTRFNVKAKGWEADLSGQRTLTPDWLDERFSLFKKFCLPSIKNQSIDNFHWLIYFNNDIECKYREQIDSICIQNKFIVPYYVNNMGEMYNNLKNDIIDNIKGNPEFLITTRLDNDDGLQTDAIALIQRYFNYQKYEFVNLSKGLIYDMDKKLLFEKYQLNNPFITLIEKYDSNFTTVWCGEHGKLSSFGSIKNFEKNYYWIKIIHERNLSNSSNDKYLKPKFLFNIFSIFGYKKDDLDITLYNYIIRYFYYKINLYIKKINNRFLCI